MLNKCPSEKINSQKACVEYNRKDTNAFAPTPLIFKFQQEVLKFNDICMNWSSPKADLDTNFLNLENWSFEDVSFSQ